MTAELMNDECAISLQNVVPRNRFVKFTGSCVGLRGILHLRSEYGDGKVEFIGTDDSWRTQAGPELFSNIYSARTSELF